MSVACAGGPAHTQGRRTMPGPAPATKYILDPITESQQRITLYETTSVRRSIGAHVRVPGLLMGGCWWW